MPLTDQDIRAITYLAARCRAADAPRWDEAGIFAAIAKVRHLNITDVVMAAIQGADDEKAITPGVISNTSSPNWQVRPVRPQPIAPYDPATACDVCAQPEHRHTPLSGHEFISAHDAMRRRDLTPKPSLPRTRDQETL